jgi:hypothetical protein
MLAGFVRRSTIISSHENITARLFFGLRIPIKLDALKVLKKSSSRR